MNDHSRETQTELELRAQVVARAVARADLARQAIDRIASLDEEIVRGVLGRAPAEVRNLHVDDIFQSEDTAGDLIRGLDRVFENLMRMAATIRRRDASTDAARTQIILLLDEVQILHRQLDFLQRFLLASDLLSELARSAYANKYRRAKSADDAAAMKASDSRDEKPAARDVLPSNRQAATAEIIVTCGHCAKQFAAPESLAGKQVTCLNCQRPLVVPPPASVASAKQPAAATAEPAPVAAEPEIPVACPGCRRRFLAQSWLAGKSVNCPSCGQTIQVPTDASQSVIDLTYDTDPLSGLPDLTDFDEYPSSQPVSVPRRTLPRQAYPTRKPTRTLDEDELPRWIWYAMGAALGLGALVLLVILVSSLWRSAHQANGNTASSGKSPAAVAEGSSGDGSNPSTVSGQSRLTLQTSKEGGYSILVSGPLTGRTQRDDANRVIRGVDTVELPQGSGFLEVSYSDQPLSADPKTELANLWQATAAAWSVSATRNEPMEYKGYPARDIRFVSENPSYPTGRVLLVAVPRGDRQRMYMISRSGPQGCAEGDEVEKIFQSFRVTP